MPPSPGHRVSLTLPLGTSLNKGRRLCCVDLWKNHGGLWEIIRNGHRLAEIPELGSGVTGRWCHVESESVFAHL